jgi:hypothetical protein
MSLVVVKLCILSFDFVIATLPLAVVRVRMPPVLVLLVL